MANEINKVESKANPNEGSIMKVNEIKLKCRDWLTLETKKNGERLVILNGVEISMTKKR